jgi:hypothetical protein
VLGKSGTVGGIFALARSIAQVVRWELVSAAPRFSSMRGSFVLPGKELAVRAVK